MTVQQLDSQIRSRLAESDVRYTAGRRRVVAALVRSDGPRSAAEIHVDIDGSVPLSSLYRSLAVLSDAGVLTMHHGSKGLTRYELAEWLAGHHHHLACVDCGTVDDIELDQRQERVLLNLVEAVAKRGGFEATGHELEIEGRCSTCR